LVKVPCTVMKRYQFFSLNSYPLQFFHGMSVNHSSCAAAAAIPNCQHHCPLSERDQNNTSHINIIEKKKKKKTKHDLKGHLKWSHYNVDFLKMICAWHPLVDSITEKSNTPHRTRFVAESQITQNTNTNFNLMQKN